jgi:hypothetical protein
MKANLVLFILLALIVVALMAPQLQAGTLPLITVTSPGEVYAGSPWTLGFEFSPQQNVYVTNLGTFDAGSGLSTSVQVGIWDTSGNLLVSATVPAGTAGILNGSFRYTAITPFLLTAGNRYVIGSYYSGTASSYNTGQGGSGSMDPTFVIVQDRFVTAGSLSYPSQTDGYSGAWLGANLEYQTTSQTAPSVPTLSTWAMALLAILLVGLGGFVAQRLGRNEA